MGGVPDSNTRGRRAAAALAVVTLAGLTAVGLVLVRGDVEATLADGGADLLAEAGLDGIEVTADGRDVRLVGRVADQAEAERARVLVAGQEGVRSVDTSALQVAAASGSSPGGQVAGAAPIFEVITVPDGLQLSGAVGSEADRDALVASAVVHLGRRRVFDELEVQPGMRPLGPRLEGITPLLAWSADSAGFRDQATLDEGVGFGMDPAGVQFFGQVSPEERQQVYAVGHRALGGEGGQISFQALLAVDPELRAEAEDDDGVADAPDDQVAGAGDVDGDGILEYGPPVLFDSGSALLDQDDLEAVDEIIVVLGGRDVEQVTVVGYTDAAGPEAANLVLSEERARVVGRVIGQILPDLRVETVGRGEQQLGDSPADSRRVLVVDRADG